MIIITIIIINVIVIIIYCGNSGEAFDVEVDNIENYGDVVDAMLRLGATVNVE